MFGKRQVRLADRVQALDRIDDVLRAGHELAHPFEAFVNEFHCDRFARIEIRVDAAAAVTDRLGDAADRQRVDPFGEHDLTRCGEH